MAANLGEEVSDWGVAVVASLLLVATPIIPLLPLSSSDQPPNTSIAGVLPPDVPREADAFNSGEY